MTGLVANQELPDDVVAVHSSLSVEYHRPAKPGRLLGRGEVIDRTGRDIRSRGELFDDEGTRVASALATLRIIRWERHSRGGVTGE